MTVTKRADGPKIDKAALRTRPPRGLVVTASYLRYRGACREGLRKFREQWPEGMPLTLGNLRKTLEKGYVSGWWVAEMLAEPKRQEFYRDDAPAQKAYDDAYEQAYESWRDGGMSVAARDRTVNTAFRRRARAEAALLSKIMGIANH